MPRTETPSIELEARAVSHDVFKQLTLAANYLVQAKSYTSDEDWDSAESDIGDAIQILQEAREKVVSVREKHGVRDG